LGYGSVGYVGDPGKLAFFIAVFSVGGILGATISPLYAIALAKTVGTGPLLVLATLVPVSAGVWLVIRYVPTLRAEGTTGKPSPLGFIHSFGKTFRIIFPLWLVCVCRDTSVEGIRFFLPLLIASRGGNIVNIGTVLFWISATGALSPMIGGKLADRFGTMRVIKITMATAPFFLIPAAMIKGIPSILLYMAGNALLQGILPVTSAASQEMAPGARSTAASMVTGLSFGLAGLLTAPIGAMADSFGLTWVLIFMGFLPLLPIPLFWKGLKEQREVNRE
jgi:MFS transporter, FSR family, fosmidomycin resistance protein